MSARCIHPGDNHSADLIKVYDGSGNPYVVCGYHRPLGRGFECGAL